MTNDETTGPYGADTGPRATPPEPVVSLQPMPWSTDVLYALLRGDANVGSAMAGVGYTPYLVEHSWLFTSHVTWVPEPDHPAGARRRGLSAGGLRWGVPRKRLSHVLSG